MLLRKTPVIAQVHPLVPLSFNESTRIAMGVEELYAQLDDFSARPDTDALLILDTEFDSELHARFPFVRCLEHPPIDLINRNMMHHLDYAREHLLTSHKIAAFIAQDVMQQSDVDVVICLLVDGLSYGDALSWDATSIYPSFIDGPSVTYRLLDNKQINPKVGFASIVNRPSIYDLLQRSGFSFAKGYTYWGQGTNTVSDYLFAGIPQGYRPMANFGSILRDLQAQDLESGTYLQIIRQGLDGLAHSHRELNDIEIGASIQSILDDIHQLLETIAAKNLRVRLYVTADHGILWKHQNSWQMLRDLKDAHPRYVDSRPSSENLHFVSRFENHAPYYLVHYPYLAARIPNNDSGVHGGLSYQESIVPLAIFEG
jgi:hypothetical protein